MAIKTKFVIKGRWQTMEYFCSASGTGFFLHPKDASVRVRYGSGKRWRGFTRQEQKLTGTKWMKLTVDGKGIATYARIQIRVKEDDVITYHMYSGRVAVSKPQLPLTSGGQSHLARGESVPREVAALDEMA